MKFYCGIDLSARDCHLCVIDEQLKVIVQQQLRNELKQIVNFKVMIDNTLEDHVQIWHPRVD